MSKLVVKKPTDNTVRFERKFSAAPERVFRAYSDADLMKKWYSDPENPVQSVESDFQEGGSFKIIWGGEQGGMVMTGTWLEIDAPRFIRSTENWEEDWTGGEVINEVEFIAQDGGTLMVMTSTYSSAEARDGATEMAAEGFGSCLDTLDQLLEAGA